MKPEISLKKLDSNHFDYQQLLYRLLLVLFFLVIAYRIYACFQVPLKTTDALRNLGYASHALDNNFAIYNTKGTDFAPEIWTLLPWTKIPFQYPPVTLIFFYAFSFFGLVGIFWVKLTLTLIELASAYLFYKHISKVAAILFFCAPVSVFYTSLEGQFEALAALFTILNAIAVQDKHWRRAGFFFVISIQVKQFAILIFPWMFYEMWRQRSSDSFISILQKVSQGAVIGFLPFLGYYLQKPDLFFLPFSTIGHLANDNLFAWNFLSDKQSSELILKKLWYSLFTYAPLIILLFVIIYERKTLRTIVSFVPLSSFFFIMKSVKLAVPWYLIFSPSLLFCFSQKKTLICLLLVIHFMQSLPYTIQAVVPNSFMAQSLSQQEIYLMKPCMFICDLNLKPLRQKI